MSLDISSERVCYVHCNFCNTILVVNVPCTNLQNAVTIRCGHCSNLLSVNMGTLLQTVQFQDLQKQNQGCGSSSEGNKVSVLDSLDSERATILPTASPEKRQRVPSAYNRFIKEEIQRIKASNPDISHKEAFSTAAKNWAHFPHIQFGLTLNSSSNNNNNIGEAFSEEGARSTQGLFYNSDDPKGICLSLKKTSIHLERERDWFYLEKSLLKKNVWLPRSFSVWMSDRLVLRERSAGAEREKLLGDG
ncbi:hypothetical protein L1049_008002 [Liquidambar formosana]|uniref:YABBY transcription factor n=1 Tax=Liquidambar formosana TaxID=63359 RepID=A0AAP0S3M0_LIQFO